MNSLNAHPAAFTGALATDDGKNAILRFLVGMQQSQLAIGAEGVLPMVTTLLHVAAQAAKARGDDPDIKQAMNTERWEVSTHGDTVIFSFRVEGGAEISFALHRDAAAYVRDTLTSALGGMPHSATPPKLSS